MGFVMNTNAQVTVTQKVDSLKILIGDQTQMHLSITAPEGSRIQWPRLKERQMLTPGVEIVSLKTDTANARGGLKRVTRHFTLTSFDERVYLLPALKVKVNGREYAGSQAPLKVLTIPVDTLHPNIFYPPKDVQDNPFQWSEWSGAFWMSVLALMLCALFIFLLVRLRQNKPIIAKVRIVKRVPAHQRALTAIKEIKDEHHSDESQQSQKEYYTQLTDTLRQYIRERFGFNAMEMTTYEIIDRLSSIGDTAMITELRELFETADLVKFAKYQTLGSESDNNLVNAIHFIDETKTDEQPTTDRIVPTLSDDDRRQRQNRIVIKILLWTIAIGVVALLVASVVRITELLM